MVEASKEPAPKGTVLEEQVKEAVRLAEIIPEKYREKSFDTLLKIACSGGLGMTKDSMSSGDVINGHKLPISVVAFMGQFNIPQSRINDYFIITGPNEIASIYKIENKAAARSQIQLACMHALEHALHDGSFEFSFEKIKTACRDNGCLDQHNFVANFRNKSNLFKSLDNKESVVLSPAGKEYLADLLDELSNKI